MIQALLANLREYWLVHVLLAVYTVLLAYHAWSGSRSTRGVADFYVGGRTMGGVALGLSFFATYSSTNSFVGFSGQSYTWGAPWLLLVPFIVGLSLFAWMVVAPRLRTLTESLDSLTVPDFIGFRFASTPARVLAAVIVLFASFFYMTAVFKGIGNILEVFLEMPYRWAIVVVFVVVMLYTAVGGFISVVKTDVVQGVIMIFAAVLLFSGTVSAAGGLGALSEVRAQPGGEALFRWGGGVAVPVLLGTLFAGTIKFAVEPRQLSRFYALGSVRAARTGLWVSTLTFAAVYALLVPIGLYAHRILGSGVAETDLVVPNLLARQDVFGPGASAFLVVAMVAAAMSSLDSVLLVMASTAQRDIVGIFRRGRTEAVEVRDTRLYVALFAAVTAILALDPPGGIVGLTALSGSLYAACFFPAILLGLYWRRGNGAAVMASYAAGLVVLFTWKRLPFSDVVHEVFPALILSLGAYALVALATSPTGPEAVRRYFGERPAEAGAGAMEGVEAGA